MPSTSTSATLLAAHKAASVAALALSALDKHQSAYELSTTSTTIAPLGNISSMLPDEHLTMSQGVGQHLLDHSATPVTSLYTFEELGHWTMDTRVAALVHALLASFSVILVSELGDKTFIITAIMAMKNARSLVFISSASALLVMTILSVGMGVAATVIPELYTHYASIVLFLCFGLKMLKESWDMKQDSDEESEFDEVKRSLEVDAYQEADASGKEPDAQQVGEKKAAVEEEVQKWYFKLVESLAIAPVVIKVFTMIFVAEWGDRSQISTVILAAREDSVGVFIGSLSGHIFCTGLAVIGGRFVADMISVRTMTLLGGIIFLFFAAFALLTGPDIA